MNHSVRMTDTERDYHSEVVESSMRVSNRHQFFSWTQGPLQRLVPHEILICGIDSGSRRGIEYFHCSSTRYFRTTHFDALCHPESGLLRHVQLAAGRTESSVVLCPQEPPVDQDQPLLDLIAANELRNLVGSLFLGPRNEVQGFYGFARVARPLDAQTAYLLDLLIPYIHVTLLRALNAETQAIRRGAKRFGRLVTQRQEEVLELIKIGKTNIEIAAILDVSPWTVKNHVQMIFQRLNTTTRSQAVSRAIRLGILRAD